MVFTNLNSIQEHINNDFKEIKLMNTDIIKQAELLHLAGFFNVYQLKFWIIWSLFSSFLYWIGYLILEYYVLI